VVFCDLRRFTAFAETAEPEEVMGVLTQYHAALGDLVFRFEGTLEHFAGDGLMVFFNDPLPCDDAPTRAVRMAVAMRTRVQDLADGWARRGYDLSFGAGIAQGYATLGRIGFEGRFDYGAIGSVTNLAARLCAEAAPWQILVTQRMNAEIEDIAVSEPVGELSLRGFSRPVPAFNVRGLDAARSTP
jgi:adenylate cyclase